MKVIDLLSKIANGEEVPQKIKYGEDTYYYEFNEYLLETENEDELRNLMGRYNLNILNDEIEEIEEDKKIEKLVFDADCTVKWNFGELYEKVNEIIDKVNKEKE